jgi:hypothetical protein
MSDSSRTPGEVVFEKYLDSQNISFEFEKEHPGKSRRPDYTIEWGGKIIVFDVKDFDPPKSFRMGFGYFDPYPPIREKIDQGRDKFKQFKEYCCGLALYNAGQPLVSLDSPDIMLGAMYGDSGFTFPMNVSTGVGDASQLKHAFLNRGKMIRAKESKVQNTTLSAIITVVSIRPHYLQLLDLVRANRRRSTEDYEAEIRSRVPDYDPELEVPRVIVWHNAVARIPFPADLFCGDYDSHYGVVSEESGNITQDVTYEGSALPDRLKLRKAPKSSPVA